MKGVIMNTPAPCRERQCIRFSRGTVLGQRPGKGGVRKIQWEVARKAPVQERSTLTTGRQ